jgi:hypothetical protein
LRISVVHSRKELPGFYEASSEVPSPHHAAHRTFTDPPEQPYEQGYQTVSPEGRQLYPDVNEDAVPPSISHQRMEEQSSSFDIDSYDS